MKFTSTTSKACRRPRTRSVTRSPADRWVVDPQRDIGEYVSDTAEAGFPIEHVLETHFNANFASGHLELIRRSAVVRSARPRT